MKLNYAALCAPIALLAACGGEDSAPNPTSGPTPTPTPTSAPTPTPTPPPTTFNELTGDQEFNTACAFGRSEGERGSAFSAFAEDFTFAFEAASETWTIAGPSRRGGVDQSFGPDDITNEEPGVFVTYRRELTLENGSTFPAFFGFNAPQADDGNDDDVDGEFVRLATVNLPASGGSTLFSHCVFGIPTELDDGLPSSTITFSTGLGNRGSGFSRIGTEQPTNFDLSDSTLTVTADPSTGEVAYTLTLQGRELIADPDNGLVPSDTITPLGVYTGSDIITGETQGFQGVNVDSSGLDIGDFTGWFFGPQGAEIGIAFNGSAMLQDSSTVTFTIAFGGPQDD